MNQPMRQLKKLITPIVLASLFVISVGGGFGTGCTKKDDLKIEDTLAGSGTEATDGKQVTVHYSGFLTDGKKFDSSLDRGMPFTFTLGQGQVIQGWDMGVKGMKVGGKRKLTIPAKLGYGEQGAGNVIPPNSTLVFEVELLDVK